MTKKRFIYGFVKSASMCFPIEKAEVILTKNNNKEISRVCTNKGGYFRFKISDSDDKFNLIINKTGYCNKIIEAKFNQEILIRLLEDEIYAYTNKLSFRPGDLVQVFVHSTKSYNCKLLRYGLNVEEILSFDYLSPMIQTVPDELFTEEGLQWKSTFSFQIPSIAKSGLYSLFLATLDQKKSYSLTFVVSPRLTDKSNLKRLLVLASTNNWQTYNIWGGRSRYRNFEHSQKNYLKYTIRKWAIKYVPENIKSSLKKIFSRNTIISLKDHADSFQFKKLSINRPHPNASINDLNVYNEFSSHLAAGEWRIIAWLEREGYDYDIVSGHDLHCNPHILENYSAIILSTHSEYWSKEMFNSLKKFYKQGGSILNLSGNSIYREVEFFEDSSIRCVSLRFSSTVEDESKLLGVRFDMKGYGTCAPYKVLKADHWVFNGTNLKNGEIFAIRSLNHNISNRRSNFNLDPSASPGLAKLRGNGGSGWETDKLTVSAPKDFILLAKGLNKNNGGAHMVIREEKGKGIIFSASSITFGGSLLIDENSSILIKNVLNRILNS